MNSPNSMNANNMSNHDTNLGPEANVRYSINLDVGGMDAIMGSLYKKAESFHGESASSVAARPRRRRSTASFYDGDVSRSRPAVSRRRSTASTSFHEQAGAGDASTEPIEKRKQSLADFRKQHVHVASRGMGADGAHEHESHRKGGHALFRESSHEPSSNNNNGQSPRRNNGSFHDRQPHHADRRCGNDNPSRGECGASSSRNPFHDRPGKNKTGPRRRSTIESCSFYSDATTTATTPDNENPIMPGTTAMRRSASANIMHDKSQRRVSWSNLHSISVIDMEKSPDATTTMNVEWEKEATFPSLPFAGGAVDVVASDSTSRNAEEVVSEGLEQPSRAAVDVMASMASNDISFRMSPEAQLETQRLIHELLGVESSSDVDQQLHTQSQQQQQQQQQSHSKSKPSVQPKQTTRVINLPWTDHRGIRGEYTGEVNFSIEPHGNGTFKPFGDVEGLNTMYSSTWRDGQLVCAKVPLGGLHCSSSSGLLRRGSSCDSAKNEEPELVDSSSPVEEEEDDAGHSPSSIESNKTTVPKTSLAGYQLGHPAEHPSHMLVPPNSQDAIDYAYSLKSLDFAFILRSTGEWTYSIVADRPFSDDGPAIRFVLDGKGSTKTIRKKYWGRGIRLVNSGLDGAMEDAIDHRRANRRDGEKSSSCRKKPIRRSSESPMNTMESVVSTRSDAAVIADIVENPKSGGDGEHINMAPHPESPSRTNNLGADIKISRKMSRRKSAPGDSLSFSMITRGAVALNVGSESLAKNMDDSEGERSPAKRDASRKKLHKSPKLDHVDESERSGNTLGSNLKAILSLEYLGTLDGIDDEPMSESGERKHYQRKVKSYHQGEFSMRHDSVGADVQGQSFHSSYDYLGRQKQKRRSSKSSRSKKTDPSRENFSKSEGHNGGGFTSSFHTVDWDEFGDDTKITATRDISHRGIQHLQGEEKKPASSRWQPKKISRHHSISSTDGVIQVDSLPYASPSSHASGLDRLSGEKERRGSNASRSDHNVRTKTDDGPSRSSSSFHTVGGSSGRSNSSSSSGGLHGMSLDQVMKNKPKKSKRRISTGSVCTVGSNASSLSSLLRELYSPEYLERAEMKMGSSSLSLTPTINP